MFYLSLVVRIFFFVNCEFELSLVLFVWQVSNANAEAVSRRCDPESSRQHDRTPLQEAGGFSAKRTPDPGRLPYGSRVCLCC